MEGQEHVVPSHHPQVMSFESVLGQSENMNQVVFHLDQNRKVRCPCRHQYWILHVKEKAPPYGQRKLDLKAVPGAIHEKAAVETGMTTRRAMMINWALVVRV